MENNKVAEIVRVVDAEHREELFEDITHEKLLELMAIHKELAFKYIKRQNMELYLKKRLWDYYDRWMLESRIEAVYFLPIQKFYKDMLSGKLD